MKISMETADKVLREYVEWEETNVGPELPPIPSEVCRTPKSTAFIQYTVEVYGKHNTVISIKTHSEEHMAELVHLVKEYLNQ